VQALALGTRFDAIEHLCDFLDLVEELERVLRPTPSSVVPGTRESDDCTGPGVFRDRTFGPIRAKAAASSDGDTS